MEGRDGISSMEVSDLENGKLPRTPCRRSKRLMLSKHIDGPDGVSSMEISALDNAKPPHTPCRRSKRLMEFSKNIDGPDGVSSMEVSDLDNTKPPHTPCRRSKRLMEFSKNIDGPDGVSSMEVSDLDNTKPPHTPCRRSKRLMEFSKHTEGDETRGVNPNQPLAKKPKFTPAFTCEICTETKPKTDIFRVKRCRHFYCSVCMAKYIGSKIRNNVLTITCPQPNCSSSLEPQQSQSILPKAIFNRWCRALCETLILDTSQGYYCPFKKCSALFINDLRENCRRSECPHCRRIFCVDCKVAWHRRLNKFIKLAMRKKWQNCPKCKFYIERSEGCNSMQCRCGCNFCYKCGKKIASACIDELISIAAECL